MKTAVAITLINTVVVFGLCSATLLSGCNHHSISPDKLANPELRASTTSRSDRSSSPIHGNLSADAAKPSLIVRPGVGIGGVHLGMSPAEVEAALGPAGRKSTPTQWEYPEEAMGVAFDARQQVSLISGGWWCFYDLPEAQKHPFTGAFENGVRVASTMEEVREAFGPPDRESVVDESQQFVRWRYTSRGMDISFRAKKLAHVMIFHTRKKGASLNDTE